MQRVTQKPLKRLSAEGKDGIISNIIIKAKESRTQPFRYFEGQDFYYESLQDEIATLDRDLCQEVLSRAIIKSKSVPLGELHKMPRRRLFLQMVKLGTGKESDIQRHKFNTADILEGHTKRMLFIEFLLKQTDRRRPFYKKLKEIAESGHYVNFEYFPRHITRLKRRIQYFKRVIDRLKVELTVIDADDLKELEKVTKQRLTDEEKEMMLSTPQKSPEEIRILNAELRIAKAKLSSLRLKLTYEIQPLYDAKSKEKAELNNLCYFLFNYGREPNRTEKDFFKKLVNLSSSNLETLIRYYINFQNEQNKLEYSAQQKHNKAMTYKPKKNLSTSDKTAKIQNLKSKGLSQSQTAKTLNISTRTVKRYWN